MEHPRLPRVLVFANWLRLNELEDPRNHMAARDMPNNKQRAYTGIPTNESPDLEKDCHQTNTYGLTDEFPKDVTLRNN